MKSLKMSENNLHQALHPFNRPNLYYEVKSLARLVRAFPMTRCRSDIGLTQTPKLRWLIFVITFVISIEDAVNLHAVSSTAALRPDATNCHPI